MKKYVGFLRLVVISITLFIGFTTNIFASEDKFKGATPKFEFDELDENAEYAGIYQLPFHILAGENLYIFPDETFVITYFCDICIGETVLTKGTYKYSKSKITLKYLNEYDGNKEKTYYARHGYLRYDKISEYEHNSPQLLDEVQFSNISNTDSFDSYLHRVTPYVNWKTHSKKLKSQPVRPDRGIPLPPNLRKISAN